MKPSALVVKAFDGSQRTIIGEVELPIQIGLHVFQITFQVMDMNPTYSCLLGHPWIHATRVVTSTLHQKMKFFVSNKLLLSQAKKILSSVNFPPSYTLMLMKMPWKLLSRHSRYPMPHLWKQRTLLRRPVRNFHL